MLGHRWATEHAIILCVLCVGTRTVDGAVGGLPCDKWGELRSAECGVRSEGGCAYCGGRTDSRTSLLRACVR
jgi:hypothetical protein